MPLSYPEAFELSVELHRSSHRRCSKKKGVLNISQNSQGLRPAILSKERLWYRGFSYEFCKTFINTYFEEHL